MNNANANASEWDEAAGGALFGASLLDGGTGAVAVWVLTAIGVLVAGLMAYVLCRLPIILGEPLPVLTLGAVWFRAVEYVALTAATGAGVVWAVWQLVEEKPAAGPGLLIRHAVAGWVFLPSSVLLGREHSRWMLLTVGVAAAVTAVGLRRILPGAESVEDDATWHDASAMQTLYGLPSGGGRLRHTFTIAMCVQTAAVSAVTGELVWAAVLLMVFLFLLIWQWGGPGWMSSAGMMSGVCGVAVLVTALVLVPWMNRPMRAGSDEYEALSLRTIHRPSIPSRDLSYVSVVLWGPPTPVQNIIPPVPRTSEFANGVITRPVVIPFDGPYWYFEAPYKEPGLLAHVAQGRPTDAGINMRSTDGDPLLMEAHQYVGKPIDLRCCGEIDVAITNADTRPGKILLDVRLTDSTAPGSPSEYLGLEQVASSTVDPMPQNRAPVREVVRFPVVRGGPMRRFDEITVIFLPEQEHAQRGAKIAVQSFTLVPQ